MIIDTPGIHILEGKEKDIQVRCKEPVVLIDSPHPSSNMDRTIHILWSTDCSVYGLIKGNYKAKIIAEGNASSSKLRYILLWDKTNVFDVDIVGSITNSHATSDIHILSLITNQSHIKLNGVVHIGSNIQKAWGHILEENIFLGESGKVTGVPSLLVHSNDVQASHAARIERIPDEKLYYLRARGISKDDATVMMIESSIANVLEWLDQKEKQKIHEDIFASLV